MKRAFAACVLAVLVALAGCGSGTPAAGTLDPAALAPPGTLAYASFDIAPQGPERAAFDAAFTKLLGRAPEAKLGEAFTRAAQTSGKLDYRSDVKPWLGDTLSVVVTRVGEHNADLALLAASTDDAKARAAIDKDLAGSHPQTRVYRDVSYKLLADGTANGVVDHFLVAGTEPAFKAVVDAARDGNSLAGSEQWKTSVGERGAGKVGLAYVDVKGVLQSLASSLPGAQRIAAPLLLGMVDLHPLVATLDAAPDSLTVDVSSPGTKPDPRGPAAASSPLIEAMPAGSWLAAALPDVGQSLSKVADMLEANPLLAAGYARAAAQLRARTGLDLDKDVLAALGDVGLFVRGTKPQTVSGRLVIQSPRPATLARTLRRLPAVIESNTRGQLTVTPRRGGFDVTGPQLARPFEVRSGLRARAKLADTVIFRKAAALIGGRPTLFLNVGSALEVAAASPHQASDAHFRKALPRLRHIEFVAAGARRDAGLDVVRAVIGLR